MKIQGIEVDDGICNYTERDEVEDAKKSKRKKRLTSEDKHISGDDRANYVFDDGLF